MSLNKRLNVFCSLLLVFVSYPHRVESLDTHSAGMFMLYNSRYLKRDFSLFLSDLFPNSQRKRMLDRNPPLFALIVRVRVRERTDEPISGYLFTLNKSISTKEIELHAQRPSPVDDGNHGEVGAKKGRSFLQGAEQKREHGSSHPTKKWP